MNHNIKHDCQLGDVESLVIEWFIETTNTSNNYDVSTKLRKVFGYRCEKVMFETCYMKSLISKCRVNVK